MRIAMTGRERERGRKGKEIMERERKESGREEKDRKRKDGKRKDGKRKDRKGKEGKRNNGKRGKGQKKKNGKRKEGEKKNKGRKYCLLQLLEMVEVQPSFSSSCLLQAPSAELMQENTYIWAMPQ